MTLGVKPRVRLDDHAVRDRFGKLDHLDGARPIRQAADEAALLQRRDQPVNAGLGAQVERVLHLVEGGRNSGLFEALMDKTKEFSLLARQHRRFPIWPPRAAETNHERTLSVPYVFCNHLI